MYELIRDTVDRSGAYYPEETETIGIYSDLTSVENAVAKNYNESYHDDLEDEAEDYDEVDAEFQFHYDNVWIFIDSEWVTIYHVEITSEGA